MARRCAGPGLMLIGAVNGFVAAGQRSNFLSMGSAMEQGRFIPSAEHPLTRAARAARVVWRRRVFWASLLVLHTAGLLAVAAELAEGVIDGASGGLRLAAMGAAVVFFVLKLIDVPALRLNPGWRSVVASALAVALLHVGVLERAWQGELEAMPAQVGVVLFLGAMFETEVVRRCVALLTGTWPPVRRRAPHLVRPERPAALRAFQYVFRPQEASHIIEVSASRAPPFSI